MIVNKKKKRLKLKAASYDNENSKEIICLI